MRLEPISFICEPAPEHPGWLTWNLTDLTRFQGSAMGFMVVRAEGADTARLRMLPERRHANANGSVHGAVTLGLIDMALFATSKVLRDVEPAGSVTLDLSTQFIGAGALERPLDAVTDILRETGRFIFLRGLVVQEDELIASFTGTVRKASSGK